MVKYTGKKILQLIISLLILSLIVFFVSGLAPGDPLRAYYGEAVERMSPEQLEYAKERLGLNNSIIVQYVDWIANAVKGDFGISYQYKQPAAEVIGKVFGNTLILTALSFAVILVLGILLAIFCVRREGKGVDKLICRIGVATNSIPEFFVALMLIMIFAVMLGVLPQSGATSLSLEAIGGEWSFDNLSDRLVHLVLPVAAIVISHLWYCTYLMRNRLSQEISKEYVLMLKAKGLSENAIIYRHCLKNIMPSVISMMAVFFPHLLGGTYVVELVFSYPGIGKLGVESAQYHDYNMLMLVCLITGAMVITINILAQIISEKLNPQIKEERGRMI